MNGYQFDEQPLFTWKRARQAGLWAIVVLLLFLWIAFLRMTVTADDDEFAFVTKDRWLKLDSIVRERGEEDRLTFNVCLREKNPQPIGFSFDEILVTPSERESAQGWSEQLFKGEGASRWKGDKIPKGSLAPEECMGLSFGFPPDFKPSGKTVEIAFRVRYALVAPKGEMQKLKLDPAREAQATLKVRDEVLAGLLGHRFLWESIVRKKVAAVPSE